MNEIKKCPKCGAEMKKEELLPHSTLGGFWKPRRILPYVCRECGCIELYEEFEKKG